MIRLIARLMIFSCGLILHGQDQAELLVRTYTYKDTLQLDFYTHTQKADQNRPLIVLVHGGGFSGGQRDGLKEAAFCKSMAGQGFAAASISYRLTRKNDSFGCNCEALDKMETFVQAAEDFIAAVNFLNAAEELNFDRKSIVAAGSSAGAETVLNAAFMLDDYRFRHLKPVRLAGLVAMAGAVVDKSYITKKNAVPTLMFHGKKDELVPYGTDAHHYCGSDLPGYLILDGSASIAEQLHSLKQPYILVTDPTGGHEMAGKAYSETQLVIRFIEEQVLEGQFIQSSLLHNQGSGTQKKSAQ